MSPVKAVAKRPGHDPLRVAAEIVAALADAVVVTGVNRQVLTANRAAAELFGRPLDDLPGTPIDDLVAATERQHVADRERRAVAGEEQRYETKIVGATGGERIVAVSTSSTLSKLSSRTIARPLGNAARSAFILASVLTCGVL